MGGICSPQDVCELVLYFCEKKKKMEEHGKKGDVGMLVGRSVNVCATKQICDGKGPFSPCANFTLAHRTLSKPIVFEDGKRENHERPKVGVAPTAT